ncbi:hypothetical protein HYZ78_03620 [Candidatus Microgenomates bacterium]|nr:hypothetical protein [Candidatus Microgenomates bacterium]
MAVWKGVPYLTYCVTIGNPQNMSFRRHKIESTIISWGLGVFGGFLMGAATTGVLGITGLSRWFLLAGMLLGGIWAVRVCLRTISQMNRIFG